MLDLHINHTLSNGLKYYRDNRAAFDEIMYDISPTLRDKYYDKLVEITVNFNKAFSEAHNKLPLITTRISERTNDREQVLGNKGHYGKNVLILNQECEINIYSNEYDIIRILHRVLQSTMLIFKGSFLSIGYLNLEFIKSEEVDLDDDLVGDNVIVFHRKVTYVAQKQLLATPPADPAVLVPWVLNPPNII